MSKAMSKAKVTYRVALNGRGGELDHFETKTSPYAVGDKSLAQEIAEKLLSEWTVIGDGDTISVSEA
jgi:hypothetical protein